MSRRLPPLKALRAFEAAARHLSFTKAAQELFVTQAAISHQVKALEEHLGLPLFRRFNRRLMLTDMGQSYYPALRDAFESMAQATQRLRHQDEDNALKISVLPSLAAKWLMPRQAGFRAAEAEWSDISRGMLRPAQSADELQMRGFWRQWHAHMQGLSKTNVQDGMPAQAEEAIPSLSDD